MGNGKEFLSLLEAPLDFECCHLLKTWPLLDYNLSLNKIHCNYLFNALI